MVLLTRRRNPAGPLQRVLYECCTAVTSAQARSTSESLELVASGIRPEHLMFWGHQAPRGRRGRQGPEPAAARRVHRRRITYSSAEHYMMAAEAQLPHPAAATRLGRRVAGFDEREWARRRFGIVVTGNLAKFSQHPGVPDFLLATGGKVLVEAASNDLWGIGPAATDERLPERWPGLNLPGYALMEVRRQLAARRRQR